MYSYEDALSSSTEYFKGDELAAKVFVDKYALRDNNKNLLEKTPDDMHLRIASEIARVEKSKYKETKMVYIIGGVRGGGGPPGDRYMCMVSGPLSKSRKPIE